MFAFSCTSPKSEQHQNRLATSASPYLREHADNPVDWYEWGPEALEKARSENKPILVSIGYASCHWCHVMEDECFMDTAVARRMNANFVCIKVDREERPDVDQVYMAAIQIISGNGGWPLNAFALPDGKPFYAGTYFPKDQWLRVLDQIDVTYKKNYNELADQAVKITRGINTAELIPATEDDKTAWSRRRYQEAYAVWQSSVDYHAGGLAGAPKFPMPVVWEFALQHYYLTSDPRSLAAVTVTLDAMAKGGIYDQLGGGFARYSTDAGWRVPHFEKMLYDNGLLSSLYAHAFQLTGDKNYETVLRETLDFIKREMTSPDGGFYSSINADSEGEEGKYYVWTRDEIENQLEGDDAARFIAYYNVVDSGNWEGGKNVLFRSGGEEAFAKGRPISLNTLRESLGRSREKLLAIREKRVRPTRDEKILTAWNALMMMGYIDAHQAMGDQNYLDAAVRNAHFLESNMLRADGHLWRNYMDGHGSVDAFLEDYAMSANAFIQLYQATFDLHWLTLARRVTDYAVAHFRDPGTGLFFFTSDQSKELVVRNTDVFDNVIPSSNSVLAAVLFQLGEFYDEEKYRSSSQSMLTQLSGPLHEDVIYYANWARLSGLVAYKPFEVAIMGADAAAVNKELQRKYFPLALFLGGNKEDLPLLANKLVAGKTIIYVCRDKVCKLPVQETETAMKQLKVN